MNTVLSASLALALAAPLVVRAETPPELAALRQEIKELRQAYEDRLQALEKRLQAAEVAPAAAAPSTAAAAASSSNANAFNPAMSLILSGLYARTSQDPSSYRLRGFALPPGAELGPGSRGFSLTESELGLSASVDPWWRGVANIALHPDNTLSVEEAYVQTTALGHGLTAKAGRFFSGLGYLNAQHTHTWDFVDNPLAYQALLGTQVNDDGLQLAWLAPTDQYLELGAELGRGRTYPGSDSGRNGAGLAVITAHTGGDWGDSHNWRAGLSVLSAQATDQSLSGLSKADTLSAFSGRTRVWVMDGVWKWSPHGNATVTNFKLQGEYLHSTRTGTLVADANGLATAGAYQAVQSGWYVQGIYQFMPRWRLGLRTEQLNPGQPDFGSNSAWFNAATEVGRKNTVMLDFNASEFSRVRLQWAQDRARLGGADNQFFVQYQMSLGAHGAHSY